MALGLGVSVTGRQGCGVAWRGDREIGEAEETTRRILPPRAVGPEAGLLGKVVKYLPSGPWRGDKGRLAVPV